MLSAEARNTLWSALSTAHHYAAVILLHFYEIDTLDILCKTPEHIRTLYSKHGRLLLSDRRYPKFRLLWERIRYQKLTFHQIAKNIRDDKPWAIAIIHRLHDNGKDDSICEKRAVLDPTNPEEYADENKFYTMLSENSYVVGKSPENRVECHIFISVDCPLTDAEVKDILAERKGNNSPFLPEIPTDGTGHMSLEKWFFGAHVVNLRRIRQIREWMDSVIPVLMDTLSSCKPIRRSKHREDPEVTKQDRCRMVAMNFNCDQQGYVRAPKNFKERLDDDMKFELMAEHDHILDGVVIVKSLFLFRKTNTRLQRNSSPGCGGSGRLKVPNTTLFQLVCSCFESQLMQSYVQASKTCCSLGSLELTMPISFIRTSPIVDLLLGYGLQTRLRMHPMRTIWCNHP